MFKFVADDWLYLHQIVGNLNSIKADECSISIPTSATPFYITTKQNWYSFLTDETCFADHAREVSGKIKAIDNCAFLLCLVDFQLCLLIASLDDAGRSRLSPAIQFGIQQSVLVFAISIMEGIGTLYWDLHLSNEKKEEELEKMATGILPRLRPRLQTH
ncbi:hypothetical protein [Rhodovulum strictum]|uniref:Uncharacterized protein n=1 Tax=Rhodovulum strictum TaxID=58314 RepID=A0A844BPH6_9RHOB|nr:hypothetical protein [Rhodovulum strictum]MRH22843.1 hypothetical protein [Rhodovulum strictum]